MGRIAEGIRLRSRRSTPATTRPSPPRCAAPAASNRTGTHNIMTLLRLALAAAVALLVAG